MIDFKSITPFCASSDENRSEKSVIGISSLIFEERRDNDSAQLWNKAASASSDENRSIGSNENRGILWT